MRPDRYDGTADVGRAAPMRRMVRNARGYSELTSSGQAGAVRPLAASPALS